MLTNDRKQIVLLNPVRVDYKLLKYRKKTGKELVAGSGDVPADVPIGLANMVNPWWTTTTGLIQIFGMVFHSPFRGSSTLLLCVK